MEWYGKTDPTDQITSHDVDAVAANTNSGTRNAHGFLVAAPLARILTASAAVQPKPLFTREKVHHVIHGVAVPTCGTISGGLSLFDCSSRKKGGSRRWTDPFAVNAPAFSPDFRVTQP